jgi:DNA-binding NtrC family response regulator
MEKSPDQPSAARVVIVSNSSVLAGVFRLALAGDYTVCTPDSRHLSATFPDETADAVILDISSDCTYDLSFAEIIARSQSQGIPVVVVATDENRQQALDLLEQGAHSLIRNPPALRELKAAIRKACDGRALSTQLRSAREELQSVRGLDHLVGSGPEMQLVYKLIRKVASLENSVLITGESGTGKELIARAIHNTGQRANRPFVAVSCGAIPETLIESELFGHEKGAFTGSVSQREGFLEQARDGTLFLDEIGELNPQVQVKLLRVLQQREFNRLGSTRNIPLRARIVLATHRDLDQMVAAGEFRQDLYYRVNVVNIKAPPLRRRPEDIPLLVPYFVRKYSEAYCKRVEAFEPDALALLQSYSWPGNVRELENVVQTAIIMAEGGTIEVSDLPEALQGIDLPDLDEEQLSSGSFERLLRDYKVKLAFDAIQQCGGNKTLAARSLSISRAYLHRLIRMDGRAPIDCGFSGIGDGRPQLVMAAGE